MTLELEVKHAATGERRRCVFVEVLASVHRRRARARAVVVRWPNAGGLATFCVASGWQLPDPDWRLTEASHQHARSLAKAEGLELPTAQRDSPLAAPGSVRRARAPDVELVAVDPRQERFPFERSGNG